MSRWTSFLFITYLNLPHYLFIFGLCKQSKCVIIFGYKHTNDLQVFTILYLHSMSDIRYELVYPKVMQQKRWQQILHFSLQCELQWYGYCAMSKANKSSAPLSKSARRGCQERRQAKIYELFAKTIIFHSSNVSNSLSCLE